MMKSIVTLCLTLLTFAIGSFAQDYNQSAPFYLNLLSSDPYLNGTGLVPCHTGAAIENLCSAAILNQTQALYGPFQFNTSTEAATANTPNSTAGQMGVLTYLLRGSNFNGMSQSYLQARHFTFVVLLLILLLRRQSPRQ